MNLTGVRLDALKTMARASEDSAGGFFARSLDVAAEPAQLGAVPILVRLQGEDCVFTFGSAVDGTRAAWLESCRGGMLDLTAATADIEAALLTLASDAAAEHGAEVQSVSLTLETEGPQRIAVTAMAVAKAMFFTATLTIRGRIELDGEFHLRLCETTCTGDGMIANLAAARLRPGIAQLEERPFQIASLLPAGLVPQEVTLTGGDALRIRAKFGGG
jgi:hypothetical protein